MILSQDQSVPGEDFNPLPPLPEGQPFEIKNFQVNDFQVNDFEMNDFQVQVNNFEGNEFQGDEFQGDEFAVNDFEAAPTEVLLSIEEVQRILRRSRATIYRYSNTDPRGRHLNLPYDPRYLNPEHRASPREPLQFHPTEVARYAQEVLKIRDINVEVVQKRSETDVVLKAILEELRGIRQLLGQWAESQAAQSPLSPQFEQSPQFETSGSFEPSPQAPQTSDSLKEPPML